MSKHEGKKIAIKFTEDLVGDVTGYTPIPIAPGDYFNPNGAVTGSSQYSSYSPSRAFDGSESSYWYTRTTGDQWIQIELDNATFLAGFRWYIGSSYRPDGFILQGSNDNTIWENIYIGNSENLTGWQEFEFDITEIAYKFIRWTITSRHSSYLYIYEIELKSAVGQEGAFSITGQEYKYVQGPNFNGKLIDKEYKPISVVKHPTINKAILLSFPTFEEFNSVVGDITIAYDAQIGSLSGRGGRVDSFTVSLSPLDLIATPNPGVTEFITVAPVEIIGDLMEMEYIDRYSEDHTITVAPVEITGTLVHISEVNP